MNRVISASSRITSSGSFNAPASASTVIVLPDPGGPRNRTRRLGVLPCSRSQSCAPAPDEALDLSARLFVQDNIIKPVRGSAQLHQVREVAARPREWHSHRLPLTGVATHLLNRPPESFGHASMTLARLGGSYLQRDREDCSSSPAALLRSIARICLALDTASVRFPSMDSADEHDTD